MFGVCVQLNGFLVVASFVVCVVPVVVTTGVVVEVV